MYGHAPPAIVCIDGALVSTCAGMQQTAARLAQMLERQPVHAVVEAPRAWHEAPTGPREMALESLRLEPGPVDPTAPDAELARILAEHLERLGWPLPWADGEVEAVEHAPASQIWAGGPAHAAAVAKAAGADQVRVWGEVMPPGDTRGVRFVPDEPGGPSASHDIG